MFDLALKIKEIPKVYYAIGIVSIIPQRKYTLMLGQI